MELLIDVLGYFQMENDPNLMVFTGDYYKVLQRGLQFIEETIEYLTFLIPKN